MSQESFDISSQALDQAQAGVAAVLLGLTLVLLPASLVVAAQWWRKQPRATWGLLGGALLVGLLLRALLPARLAMVFIGYRITEQAAELFPVGHYGIGATALYHLLLGVFGVDHRVITTANTVMGILTLPLIATFAGRLFRDARVGAVTGALYAAVPLFVRNDLSESNHVPSLLWMWAGLVLWQQFLEGRRGLVLACAVPLLALASIGRPELVLIAAGLLLVAWLGAREAGVAVPSWRALVSAGVVFAALLIPHLLHVMNAVSALEERGNIMQSVSVGSFLSHVTGRHVLVQPDLFPLGLTLAAAWALWRKPGARAMRWMLAAVILGTICVYFADTDRANAARVGVPAGSLAILLAAAALVELRERGRGLAIAGGSVVVLTALPTAWVHFQPTNEQAEEELIRRAKAALPREPHTLIRVEQPDADRARPRGYTHLYFPEYLFLPPSGSASIYSVSRFLQAPRFESPVFFLRSFRCYAQFQRAGEPAMTGDNLHPVCARMANDFHLEPVFEEDAPNHGNVWIRYYGDAPTLKVGLYRVLPKGGAATGSTARPLEVPTP